MDLKEAAKEHKRQSEIARRRTFAVISHPDAGKTTLTEKLLLFAGAIQSAGAVKARKSARHATSDWMEIEKERGISVASSVMQFEHRDHVVNLLDTPGHQDFSEDTYRVLTAVDAALMLIDAAKGVEERTIKLLEVCRLRATPIITFVNKLDREVRDPLELMDEIERVLDIECAPVTWPIGAGKVFRGVYALERDEVMLFAPGRDKAGGAVEVVRGLDDPRIAAMCGPGAPELKRAADEIGLVRAAGHRFDRKRFLDGRQTPVFFGSAINNFGVREVLDALVDLAPPPGARDAGTRLVQPTEPSFSGFVFKIQANMDPLHRDRVAFMRVCSGRFQRGMMLRHLRTGKTMRCASVVSFLSQRREAVEDAWPGDVIGLYNRGGIQIGDTFSEGEELRFAGIPFFAPELFATVRLRDPIKSKQLRKGLQQLGEEGAIQVLRPLFASDTVLGAVGPLQFEVTVHRLRTEYGVDATFETAPYKLARWVSADSREDLARFERENASRLARDAAGDLAILLTVPPLLEVVQKQWPRVRFHATREHAGLDAS
jgi:peptide chain release factor 3